jgi:hypothetical protein
MKIRHTNSNPDYTIWCPGCECAHGIWTTADSSGGGRWTFDGNYDSPTIMGRNGSESGRSLVVKDEHGAITCHVVIDKGMLIYKADSTHLLQGTTVSMQDF